MDRVSGHVTLKSDLFPPSLGPELSMIPGQAVHPLAILTLAGKSLWSLEIQASRSPGWYRHQGPAFRQPGFKIL